MNPVKQVGITLPLRSKIVIAQTFFSLLIVTILLIISTSMVFEDKKAYLYDAVFSNVKTSNQLLERYFSSKVLNAQSIKIEKNISNEVSSLLSLDSDLYTVHRYINEDENKEVYKNSSHEHKYRKNRSFLKQDTDSLRNLIIKSQQKNVATSIEYKQGKMPFFNVSVYNQETKETILYTYLLDSIFEEIFSKKGYENALVKTSGEIVYKNIPYLFADQQTNFYLKFLDKIQSLKKTAKELGLKEEKKLDGKYMIAYKRLKNFKDFYIVSEINNKKAYSVTTNLAMKTFSYAVILIGFLNILSLLLSKSITGPLNDLIAGIKKISEGEYETKIKIETKDEFKQVATSFNEMGTKIVEYNNKLQEYNRTLEDKVNERTADLNEANEFINTMINSLDQGLLVFNQLGKCQDTFTKPCKDFFKKSPKGQRVKDLIKPKDEDLFNEWIKNLFLEPIPFKSLVELGPKSIPTDFIAKDKDFQHVTLNYYPMRDNEEKITNIVLVATDKTKEFLANEKVKEQNDYIKFLSSVLSNRKEFDNLVSFFKEKLDIIESNPPKDWEKKEIKDDFLMLLHSLKGGFSLFNMTKLIESIHLYESFVSENPIIHKDVLIKMNEFNEIINSDIEKLDALINTEAESDENIDLSMAAVDHFQKILHAKGYEAIAKQFRILFTKAPIKSYIKSYIPMMRKLSVELGKKLNEINISGGNILVDKEHYEYFFSSCVHLFRNGIDHGIEIESIRKQAGKLPGGNVNIDFSVVKKENKRYIKFVVEDDGGGIDPARVRAKMELLGYNEKDLKKVNDEIIYHIFDMELSTAEQVTEVSGRGVGLSDVKKRAMELGGDVKLTSTVGKGSKFEFTLPYK